MGNKNFVHLHVIANSRCWMAWSKIDALVSRATELGMPALAITDHGAMYGVMDFIAPAAPPISARSSAWKLIWRRAAAMTATRNATAKPRTCCYSRKTGQAYQKSAPSGEHCQLEGHFYHPRLDREILAEHVDGLIATSSCLAGEIPQLVLGRREEEARQHMHWYADVFGDDNFFLELQQHEIEELRRVNQWLVAESRGARPLGLLATNDVHYVRQEDHDPHDTLLCIQTNTLKSQSNRMRMSDASYYLGMRQRRCGRNLANYQTR